MYRKSARNNEADLFHECESLLQAYYDLIDDCKDYPLWERKIQEDLGGVVSFIGVQMDESIRDKLVSSSPVFERFDSEK